jgi:hypothetical protein
MCFPAGCATFDDDVLAEMEKRGGFTDCSDYAASSTPTPAIVGIVLGVLIVVGGGFAIYKYYIRGGAKS